MFRCVSKTLLGIVDCPYFIALHTAAVGAIAEEPPRLMRVIRSYDGNRQPFTRLQSLKYKSSSSSSAGEGDFDVSDILFISDDECVYHVRFVFNNLFCSKHRWNHGLCFLIDPFRGDVMQLPESNNSNIAQVKEIGKITDVAMGMGFDTITNTYKIVRVYKFVYHYTRHRLHEEGYMVAEVLVLGTNIWRKISSTPPFCTLLSINNVYAHGDMHWFDNGFTRNGIKGIYHIIFFDFRREEFYWTPNPASQRSSVVQLHLITLRGSIAVVDTSSPRNIEIWVMKDSHKKEWAIDYAVNTLDFGFEFDTLLFSVCGEWEHGLLFIDE